MDVAVVMTVVMTMLMAFLDRRPLWHQKHLALGAAPRVVLPNFRMHGAVVDKRCACWHGLWLQVQLHGDNGHRSRGQVGLRKCLARPVK